MLKRRALLASLPIALTAFMAARALAQTNPAATPSKNTMLYRTLGSSDLRVSVLGLGCNSYGAAPGGGGRYLDLERTRAVVNAAYDAGVTFFDTADMYGADSGSEKYLGEILKDRRKQVVLATKWGIAGRSNPDAAMGTRAAVRQSLENSLRRMQTDYIDLYQLHFPDQKTPIGETLAALDELVREGKIRHIGASNFSAAQIAEADKVARERKLARFISVQNQYSLLETDAEADVLPTCARLGIGFIPYFPLASGLLTGKYRRNQPAPAGARLSNRPISDDVYDRIEELEKFAKQRGRTLLDLAVAGLASRPEVGSVIAGATKPEQVRENAASVSWQLTADDIGALQKLTSKA
jgi:aryl-alcohol dehydrogenase-like predicted oxidoreductase